MRTELRTLQQQHTQRVTELERSLTASQSQLASAAVQRSSQQEQAAMVHLHGEVSRLQQELRAARHQMVDLSGAVASLGHIRGEVARLQANVFASYTHSLNQRNASPESANAPPRSPSPDAPGHTADVDRFEHQLTAATQDLAKLAAAVQRANADKAQLVQQLEHSNSNNARMADELERASREIAAALASAPAATGQDGVAAAERMAAHIQELRSTGDAAEARCRDLESELAGAHTFFYASDLFAMYDLLS